MSSSSDNLAATAVARVATCAVLALLSAAAVGQSARGAKPSFSGIWRAASAANWDLEPHAAEPGPVPSLGTLLAVPPGPGVVVGGAIPYLPGALEQRNKNREQRWTADPEIKCFMPGVPRANYLPYPFQIVQGTDAIIMTYEFADAVRTVYLTDPGPAPANSWMGWNVGRFDGNTLVVDVTAQHDDTWLDRSGNYHSDELHVVERYTLRSPDVIDYEATIEDPQVFSRPWTIRLPLYRDTTENARLMEFKCIPFAEPVLYDKVGR
ncbi:MAG TPA: hypothetical protein VM692_01785 [Gammaproteobacteria bacterium]|nr:hypothetical protein [Gammaproteobacteria bacterium]